LPTPSGDKKPKKTFKLKFNTLTSKLVPTYFLVMIITFLMFSYYITNSITSYMNSNEKKEAITQAEVIARIASDTEKGFISSDFKTISPDFDTFLTDTLKISTDSRVVITNDKAESIYDSFHDQESVAAVKENQGLLKSISTGKTEFEITKSDSGISVVNVAVPIVTSSRPTHPIGAVYLTYELSSNDFISSLTKDMIIIFIAITLVMGLFIFIVANLMTKRIVDLTNRITRMSKDGIIDEKMDEKGNDEVARLAAAFNRMNEKLAVLEKKRVEFVSDASHELKTPLSSIKLMCDSIIQNPNLDQESIQEFLNDINSETGRLSRIIEKLLYLTKLDLANSEKRILNAEFVDIREIVMDIVKNLTPIAEQKNISINTVYCESVHIMADRDRLWQGVYNIIDNAIKYTKENGQVVIGITKDGNDAIIAVKDSGIGISEDNLKLIFDRFYRVDKARSRETGGSGLGLAIASESIEMIGGTIDVKSSEGEGTTFSVSIPLFTHNNPKLKSKDKGQELKI